MSYTKRKDGFLGEKQINIPQAILDKFVRPYPFSNALFITHIGYFPKAQFHYRERKRGCEDNILIYCLKGKGHYETPQGEFTLTANQFMMLPPNQFHRYQADIDDPWSIYWVHFSGSRLNELNQWGQSDQYLHPSPIEYNDTILEIWNDMYASLDAGYTSNNMGYANLCLYHFLSFFLFPGKRSKKLIEDSPLDKSILFMKANIDKQLTVENIAGKFNYSASHYTSLFKKKTGLSPIEYFIQIKIHFACQLLTQSSIKIKEIAEKIGYDDPYYFSRLFRNATGKSPNEYRKNAVQKQPAPDHASPTQKK